jgi:RHS repeat-associated protein
MKKIYLLALLCVLNFCEIKAQNVDYSTALYTNATFTKTIDPSLPVGSISGSGGVSSGGATYAIPIGLPPGTNGITPSLSIEYNSMSANDFLGSGWNLSGLSSINRSGQNLYYDGKVTPVDLSNNDRFTLDGQRLIGVTGIYGGNAATYATESESYSVTTSYGTTGSGPTYFKVVSKDGTEMEFGNTPDSRITDQSNTNILFWRLNKIKYPDGNYITFKYTFNAASDRDSRIDEINYTGNDAAGIVPYNRIKFSYKVRADINTHYVAGSSLTNKYLLDKISITAETANVQAYEFKYGWDNVNSYLREIVESGSDGAKLNATIFKYGDKPVLNTVSSGSIPVSNNITSFNGDYDGDGMPDILSIKGSEGAVNSFSTWKRDQSNGAYTLMATQSVPQTSTFRIGKNEIPGVKQQFSSDINGDGLSDVSLFAIQAVTDNTGNFLYSRIDNILHYVSNPGGSSFTAQTQSMPVVGGVAYNILHPSGNFVFQGDFDGDGLTEQVFQLKNTLTNEDLKIFYYDNAAGSYSYTEVMQFIPVNGNGNIRQDWWNAKEHQIIDFNGDGKQDIALFWDNWVEIFTFDDATHARSLYNSSTFPISTPSNVVHFGDFNGDGKMDALTIEDAMSSVVKGISTGSSFIQSPFPIVDHWSVKATTKNIRSYFVLGDFNGDGKSDTYFSWKRFGDTSGDGSFFPYTIGNDIYYSTGDGFYNEQVDFEYDIEPVAQRPPPSSTFDVPVDLNGDGRSDIVSGSTHVISRIDFFNTSGTDNLLNKVSNGLNHVTEWNYKSLAANAALYTKGGTSTYPLNIIQPAALLVTDLKVQNGIGGTSVVQYNYEGLRLHRAGKGFLGFAKVTATDLTMGMKTISENEFDPTFFTAAPKKNATYLTSDNALLTETTQVNEFIAQGAVDSKRFLYRLKSSFEDNKFEDRTVTSTNDTFDNFGNVKQSTVNNNNIETTVTSTNYGAYVTAIDNRPTSVTVTKTRSGQPAFTVNTAFDYYANGQLKTKTNFNGLSKKVVTGYEYHAAGYLRKTTITGYEGGTALPARITSAVYDPKGRYPETSTNELNQTTSATYDAKWGKQLTATGVDGLVTTNQYDAFGRLKQVTVPGSPAYSVIQTYGWGLAGQPLWYNLVTHPGKPDVKTWYDVLGREVITETEAYPSGLITQAQTYDARGNVATSTQPYKSGESFITTTTQYDTYNRPFNINSGALGTTTIGYSYAGGNLTVTSIAPTGTTSKTTDATGQAVIATDNGGTLSYTYYSHGGLKDVKNGGTTLTSNEYDEYGRQTKLIDANAGTTQYVYNALGQLVSQTNANNQTHAMLYDVLGRNTTRTGPEGTTGYEYFPSGSGTSTNQIKKVTGFSGNLQEFTYGPVGRVETLRETVDTEHTTRYEYNAYGDLTTTTYPSGFKTIQAYDANGYPTTIQNNSGGTLYSTGSINGQGQVTAYSLGNGKSSSVNYTNGFSTQYLTAGLQNLNMVWDYTTGNLTSRNDAVKNKTESFIYDNLNRLKTTTLGSTSLTINYAANGNISLKPDAGIYSYHPVKFNAVTGVTNPTPSPIPSLQQDITYTAFMQPNVVSENNFELTYTYGADYERIKGVTKQNGTVIDTRYYLGGYEKDITGGVTKYIQYVGSPAGLIAIVTSEGATHTPHFVYTDHLGSILTVTNNAGAIEAEQSFDAWGRRRNPASWALLPPTAATALPTWLYRGYTGHEHLDRFGLINMNGRMYDPVVGRMLSADNYVQEPGMTQSYNRYTYAMNNPMVNTDPNGQFWNFVVGGILGGFSGYKIGKASGAHGWGLLGFTLGGAAIGTFTGGLADAAIASFGVASSGVSAASIGAYAAAGAITGAVSGASFAALAGGGAGDLGKAALWGGAIGGATGALNGFLRYNQTQNSLSRYISNSDNWSAQIGGPGSVAWTRSLQEVLIKRPWWQQIGLNLAEGASAVLTLPFILDGDVSRKPQAQLYYHYTNAAGFKGITSTMNIYPDAKNRVFISNTPFNKADAHQNLFLNQSTHAGKGDYLIGFSLTPDQQANLVFNPGQGAFEYVHYGRLRLSLDRIKYAGPNPFK